MTELNLKKEENIQQSLLSKFKTLEGKITVKRARRLFAEVDFSNFRDVFHYAVKDLNFNVMCMITGLDEGENFSFIYHLANFDGVILDVKTSVPKSNPVIKTIMEYFPGAVLYERELTDMFGVKVEGLPEGNRYPLPDGWPEGQYPLRKDWNKEMLNQKEEK
ncbi:MAG: NADH-quinone oxidoreductase subunit C [bacterium]